MSDGSLGKTLFIEYSAEMWFRVRPVALESGWLTIAPQRGVDPVSAQRELMRMGQVVNVIAFAPARGSPADFFAP